MSVGSVIILLKPPLLLAITVRMLIRKSKFGTRARETRGTENNNGQQYDAYRLQKSYVRQITIQYYVRKS